MEWKNEWEWVIGGGSIDMNEGGYIATAEMGLPFYITVVIPDDKNTKQVVLQGKMAKLVQISPEKKISNAYTEKPVTGNEIEELK